MVLFETPDSKPAVHSLLSVSSFPLSLNWNPVWKSCLLLASCAFWLTECYGGTDRPIFSVDEYHGRWQIALHYFIFFFYYLSRVANPSHTFLFKSVWCRLLSLLQMLLVKQLLRKHLVATYWDTSCCLRRHKCYHFPCNLHLSGLLFSSVNLFI